MMDFKTCLVMSLLQRKKNASVIKWSSLENVILGELEDDKMKWSFEWFHTHFNEQEV